MAKEPNTQAPVAVEQDKLVEKSIIEEERVDEFAVGQFQAMGHKVALSDTTVKVYAEFKLRKDRLMPGRLTPEGFAFVDLMSEILEGKFTVPPESTED